MPLLFLHGVVDEWSPAYVHRNYGSRAAFEAHLRARGTPYGRWEDAAHADQLSVDDSTRAGAEACLLARELGHEIAFFINPLQIERGDPYFFSYLDASIDACTVSSIEYGGSTFDLESPVERRQFRRAVKAAVMGLASDDATAAVQELATRLGAEDVQPASHALPITLDDLRQLAAAGVRIENHGWSHVDIAALSRSGFADHVAQGRAWIRERLRWDSRLYAVPFGISDVPEEWGELAGDAYFLAREDLPPERLTERCWNRHDLTPHLQRR